MPPTLSSTTSLITMSANTRYNVRFSRVANWPIQNFHIPYSRHVLPRGHYIRQFVAKIPSPFMPGLSIYCCGITIFRASVPDRSLDDPSFFSFFVELKLFVQAQINASVDQ
ncbi:hypothetical protein AVEN_135672-1 [Araneus ventricosus]|uniref:Uncharacterized protein n=1 Tax=Araneus ventricosus TaxID=182803 RepID=A0A4Y2Q250_ARAVE|nr:hypothetical protein AVEN_135672-1 [Araneus ventricosus]